MKVNHNLIAARDVQLEMNVLLICLPLLLAGVSLTYSLGGEEELVTLPFGDPLGDHFGPHGADAVSNEIMLAGKYIFYGREETSLFVSKNILHSSLLILIRILPMSCIGVITATCVAIAKQCHA
jgi:hypothetical protein